MGLLLICSAALSRLSVVVPVSFNVVQKTSVGVGKRWIASAGREWGRDVVARGVKKGNQGAIPRGTKVSSKSREGSQLIVWRSAKDWSRERRFKWSGVVPFC